MSDRGGDVELSVVRRCFVPFRVTPREAVLDKKRKRTKSVSRNATSGHTRKSIAVDEGEPLPKRMKVVKDTSSIKARLRSSGPPPLLRGKAEAEEEGESGTQFWRRALRSDNLGESAKEILTTSARKRHRGCSKVEENPDEVGSAAAEAMEEVVRHGSDTKEDDDANDAKCKEEVKEEEVEEELEEDNSGGSDDDDEDDEVPQEPVPKRWTKRWRSDSPAPQRFSRRNPAYAHFKDTHMTFSGRNQGRVLLTASWFSMGIKRYPFTYSGVEDRSGIDKWPVDEIMLSK